MIGVVRYPFAYTGNAAPANIDLLEVNAAAGRPMRFIGYRIWQTSDVGDAAEEIIPLIATTGNATSGSGGSTSTGVALDADAASLGSTGEQANTTVAGSGTTRYRTGWNIRMEKDIMLAEAEQVPIPGGGRFVFKYNAAPSDSLAIEGECLFVEY